MCFGRDVTIPLTAAQIVAIWHHLAAAFYRDSGLVQIPIMSTQAARTRARGRFKPGISGGRLLAESVLLSIIGAAFGILTAHWGVGIVSTMMPPDFILREAEIQLNGAVLKRM